MKITAAISKGPKAKFSIEEIELAEPNEKEILVRMLGVGICHTDIDWRDLNIGPAVFGHEGSGVVEKVGKQVTKVQAGDHVVLTFASCGVCDYCQSGEPSYCANFESLNCSGTRPDGSSTLFKDGSPIFGNFFAQSSFASHALANERNVVKVNQDAPIELLGPLGCGFQTGAGAVINVLHPRSGQTIAIFGTGAVGSAAIMAAVLTGCSQIIAVDINPKRLEIAKDLGATRTINPNENNPVQRIQELTGKKNGVDYTLECTGNPEVLLQAIDALGFRGICGMVGVGKVGAKFSLEMTKLLFGGRQLRGILEGDSVPDVFIPRLVALYKQGRFPFDRLIKTYPLEAFNQAVEDTITGKVVKSVIDFNQIG